MIESLGIIANNVSGAVADTVSPDDLPIKVLRFMWQAAARRLLPNERVSSCLRKMIPGAEKVEIHHSQKLGRAAYRNLIVCARVWHCPVCAARISEERRRTLSGQLAWLPYQPIMITYTIRHDREDDLKDLLDLVNEAHRKFRQGRAWQRIEKDYGMIASLRALEVTHGGNGWHVHIHELMLLRQNLDKEMLMLSDDLKERWQATVQRLGGDATLEHGVVITMDRESIGDYVAKYGKDDFLQKPATWRIEHEIAKSHVKLGKKNGRTPNQLLHDYCFHSDLRAGLLWKEYAITFKGKRQLHPASFAALLGEQDVPDDVVAADQDNSFSPLAALTWEQWQRIWRNKDYRGQLLYMADQGDFDVLAEWLEPLGIYLDRPDGAGG